MAENPMDRYISDAPLDLAALIAQTEDHACGALAVFVGTVREHNEGRQVVGITYEAQRALAARVLREIEVEACRRFDIRSCTLAHRVGPLKLGDASVAVVVRAGHRPAAFEAQRFAIDALKERAPIWKLEHYADGSEAYLKGCSLVSGKQEET